MWPEIPICWNLSKKWSKKEAQGRSTNQCFLVCFGLGVKMVPRDSQRGPSTLPDLDFWWFRNPNCLHFLICSISGDSENPSIQRPIHPSIHHRIYQSIDQSINQSIESMTRLDRPAQMQENELTNWARWREGRRQLDIYIYIHLKYWY